MDTATKRPTTREEALALADDWDQVADNETEDEEEYQRLRAEAAKYRALAERLPSRQA